MYLKRFNRYNCRCKPSTSAAHVQEHAHARDFMTMSGKVGARSRARKRRTHRQTHTHRRNGACTRARGGGRRERDERWRGAADGGARAADDGASAVADGARAVASFVVDGDHPPPPPEPPVSIPSHKIVFDQGTWAEMAPGDRPGCASEVARLRA